MKVRFLGTGHLGGKNRLTSFVVDDHILFDIGYGVITALRENGLDTADIDFIVVSHFHPDHLGDIAYFLYRRKGKYENKPVTIIGPAGTKAMIKKLYRAFQYDPEEEDELRFFGMENVKFVELGNNEVYDNGQSEFSVRAFDTAHSRTLTCNGYILTENGVTLGYTGDSSLCEGFRSNLGNAQVWIVDAAHLNSNTAYQQSAHMRHMTLGQVAALARRYKSKRFYTVHRQDYPALCPVPNVFFPKDNEIIKI